MENNISKQYEEAAINYQMNSYFVINATKALKHSPNFYPFNL